MKDESDDRASDQSKPHAAERDTKQLQQQHSEIDEYYMRQALHVAKAALEIGEVPVGCVIVMHVQDEKAACWSDEDVTVIVSHGANQVNATRDATRHAELVAMDRMLTGGAFSDQLRLPPDVIAESAHGNVPADSPLLLSDEKRNEFMQDKLINVPDDRKHWKNTYGWGSGRIYAPDTFARCDLYATCEPCIMCAAALAHVGMGRVFFGCRNDRFGGCGSLMHLHRSDALPSDSHTGYPIIGGVLKDEAVSLLRSFYDRENFHAPDDKRKRKGEMRR